MAIISSNDLFNAEDAVEVFIAQKPFGPGRKIMVRNIIKRFRGFVSDNIIVDLVLDNEEKVTIFSTAIFLATR